ncbi:MAG TPA: crotonase/enoyl-CoA hydratase family protein [Kofleriaceae bacterium]|nr:crotonase/enoyl-CoA hydratase family protein [Kofleriaceae bacterium]
MATYETLTVERRERLFLIGLNRAAKLNSFNLAMLRELGQAYAEYEADAGARCAVLFAHGDHFTSGLDLAEVGPAVASGRSLFPDDAIDPLDLGPPRRTKPVVCVVHGWCLTIGIELLLACDVRVAAEGTRFRQMEVNRGIMPFGGATLRFHQLAGFGNAMRWLLTGDELDADEAHRIGLVQEVAPAGETLDRGIGIATRIAACAPLAVRATRASALTALERGREAAYAELMHEARALMSTEDAVEGVRSFIERRPADFKGR